MKLAQRPVPKPADGEVLVRVAAAGVNRPDVMQRQGRYPAPARASRFARARDRRRNRRARTAAFPGWRSATRSLRCCRAAATRSMPWPPRRCACPYQRASAWCEAAAIAGDLFHGLDESVRSRPVQGGRHRPDSRRHQRHRHHRYPARRRLGRAGLRDRAAPRTRRSACLKLGAVRGIDYRTEDFVEVIARADRGKGVDIILGHGGRQLSGPQSRAAARRRSACQYLTARRRASRNQHAHHHDQAADADRFDAASANRRNRRPWSPTRFARMSGRCSPRAAFAPSFMRRFPWRRPAKRIG